MSYTTEGMPQGTPISSKGFIRDALIGELNAINSYQRSIAYSDIPELNKFLLEIMKDEIHHYHLLTDYLNKIDKEQAEMFNAIRKQDFNVGFKQNPLEVKFQPTTNIPSQLRMNIKGELEAILSYDEIESKLKDPQGKALIHAITKDEKQHIVELDTMVSNIMSIPRIIGDL